MHVIALRQPDQIRPFLLTDRFLADYALGDLDPAHFQFTEWFGAQEDDQLCALAMLYHDLTPPIFFATGEARGIEAILDRVVQLPQIGLSIREEHMPAVETYYRTELVPMLKMALLPGDFRPVTATSLRAHSVKQSRGAQGEMASSPSFDSAALRSGARTCPALRSGVAVTRLDVSYTPQLEALYAHGGGDAFRQRSLELGVFYGVFDKDHLVSVAGTHIVSDNERIAALGNVMTHPHYRGRGLATAATSAVCEELLERGIEMIGLSVGRSNVAAIRVYESIGFKRRLPFFEGTATRKEGGIRS